jgi:hypothetical protein
MRLVAAGLRVEHGDRGANRVKATARSVAIAYLVGELDNVVALPVSVACAAIGVEPEALARIVRERSAAGVGGVAGSLVRRKEAVRCSASERRHPIGDCLHT